MKKKGNIFKRVIKWLDLWMLAFDNGRNPKYILINKYNSKLGAYYGSSYVYEAGSYDNLKDVNRFLRDEVSKVERDDWVVYKLVKLTTK